jgi:hypothetical protein
MIMVAAVVLSLFGTAINQVSGLSSAANTTIASVQTSGFGALQLLTVVIYVLASLSLRDLDRKAVAIIGAVMGIFAYLRMRNE